MAQLIDIYDIGSRGNLRGKAAEGFIRPTIKQFFTSSPDFKEIIANMKVGAFNMLVNSTTIYESIVRLSETKALITYRNESQSNRFEARVLTINGDTITTGTPFVVVDDPLHSFIFDAVALTSDRVLFALRDQDTNISMFHLEISGDTINHGSGSGTFIANSDGGGLAMDKISDTKALVVFTHRSSVGDGRSYARIITASSGSFSMSNLLQLFGNVCYRTISCTVLSPTRALVGVTFASSRLGYLALLNISDGSFGKLHQLYMGSHIYSYEESMASLTETKAVHLHGNNLRIYDITGDTTTLLNMVVLAQSSITSYTIRSISETEVVILYVSNGNTYLRKLTINGSVVTEKNEVEVMTGIAPNYMDFIVSDEYTNGVLCYSDPNAGNVLKGAMISSL